MKTPLFKKSTLYSDLDKNLTINPLSADIVRFVEEESIKEALKNLILTNKGERLFQPNIGCDVQKMLFENMSDDVFHLCKELIKTVIKTYEPRVNLISTEIYSNDSNSITITLTYNIQSSETARTLEFILKRVR